MADVVEKEDINEALRLMEMSKQSLYEEETRFQYVTTLCSCCCGMLGIKNKMVEFHSQRHREGGFEGFGRTPLSN